MRDHSRQSVSSGSKCSTCCTNNRSNALVRKTCTRQFGPHWLRSFPALFTQPDGRNKPLDSRVLCLYRDGQDTLYRIHGTTELSSIGRAMSNGCFRMPSERVEDLLEQRSFSIDESSFRAGSRRRSGRTGNGLPPTPSGHTVRYRRW